MPSTRAASAALRSSRVKAVLPDASSGMRGIAHRHGAVSLVVVDRVDVVGIAIIETKDRRLVARCRDAPISLQGALQREEPVSGQVEVRESARVVEVGQGERDATRHAGAHSAGIVALVHTLEAAMTKPSIQELVCRVEVYPSIRTPVRPLYVPPAVMRGIGIPGSAIISFPDGKRLPGERDVTGPGELETAVPAFEARRILWNAVNRDKAR